MSNEDAIVLGDLEEPQRQSLIDAANTPGRIELSKGGGMEKLSTYHRKLLAATICKGANDAELALFMNTCNRLKLDPFARQIFAVKRWDNKEKREVMSIQVSIDGFRLVASRSEAYAGQTEPQFTNGEKCGPCDGDGVLVASNEPRHCPACDGDGLRWTKTWLSEKPPLAARVGVVRHGFDRPVYATATWSSYAVFFNGKLGVMWQKMPEVMLGKCAESLALRKAFPNELSGVYAEEEMHQAGGQEKRPRAKAAPQTTLNDLVDRHKPEELAPDASTDEPPHDSETGEVDEMDADPTIPKEETK